MRATRRGFTLVELIVVLAILGIVVAVAAPALRRVDGDAPRDTAAELAAAVAKASTAAARRGAPVRLELELATGAWTLWSEDPPRGESRLAADTIRLAAGARLEGGRDGWATATFDALGRARAGAVTVRQGTAQWVVAVEPWTGAADVRR